MQSKRRFSIHLDTDESLCACASASSLFFFLKSAFHLFLVGLMHCLQKQTSFFIKTFIKNGSHSTIHTFKNYFATVFLVFNFQFSTFNCIQTDPQQILVSSTCKISYCSKRDLGFNSGLYQKPINVFIIRSRCYKLKLSNIYIYIYSI